MGVESTLVPSLRAAVEGRWNDVNWNVTKSTCQSTRAGLDNLQGSENHGVLAWLIALVVAWRRPQDLHRLSLTRQQVIDWWFRELTDRLRKDLQLTEARSRIYAEWGAVVICWCYKAFHAQPALRSLHLRYTRATAAFVALSTYRAKPRRYDPKVDAKMFKEDLFVTLSGARSWSGDSTGGDSRIEKAHHLGQSGWEPFAADLLGVAVPREFEWHRALLSKLKPGSMGMSSADVAEFKGAINQGDPSTLDTIMQWLDGVGSLWPCRIVRFEWGVVCIGLNRGINGNTAAIYAMAIHEDGTIYYLAPNPGNRHQADPEPCGVVVDDQGDGNVRYAAWAGGEDWPKRELVLNPSRWGRVVWDVQVNRNGKHEVFIPKEGQPPGPGPGPEPPDPTPPPDKDEPCEDWPFFLKWLCKLFN